MVATDLGLGQPVEHMIRSARIALRLGRRLGLDEGDLQRLYEVSLLTHVGCPVYGDVPSVFGDDIDFRSRVPEVDLAGFPAMVSMLRRVTATGPALSRLGRLGRTAGGRARTSRTLTSQELDEVLEALGDFCDLRCPYFAGHARGTATPASGAARHLRCPDDTVTLLYRAGLVHDMGRAGVPGSILDKPGPTHQRRALMHRRRLALMVKDRSVILLIVDPWLVTRRK